MKQVGSVPEMKTQIIHIMAFSFLVQLSVWPVILRICTGSSFLAAKAFYSGFLGGCAVLLPEVAYLCMASINHRKISAPVIFAEIMLGKLIKLVLFAALVSLCLKFVSLTLFVFFTAIVAEVFALFVAFVRKSCR